jgi:hypothetical protein
LNALLSGDPILDIRLEVRDLEIISGSLILSVASITLVNHDFDKGAYHFKSKLLNKYQTGIYFVLMD